MIEFDNHQTKKYNVTPLLEKKMFYSLKNSAFFQNVEIEQGGDAIAWDKNIDISEYELWQNGQVI